MSRLLDYIHIGKRRISRLRPLDESETLLYGESTDVQRYVFLARIGEALIDAKINDVNVRFTVGDDCKTIKGILAVDTVSKLSHSARLIGNGYDIGRKLCTMVKLGRLGMKRFQQ